MAILFDTTVCVLLLRRQPRSGTEALLKVAHTEIGAGAAAISSTTVSELMVGERDPRRAASLLSVLIRIPAVPLAAEVAAKAGTMGAFLYVRGAPIPLPDLLIAATALWLEIPLLAWDAHYHRSRRTAVDSRSKHPGAELWRALELHAACLTSS